MQSSLLNRRHGRSVSSAHKDPCLRKNDNEMFIKSISEHELSPEEIAFHMSLDAGSLPIPEASSVEIIKQRFDIPAQREPGLLCPESTFNTDLKAEFGHSNNAFSGKAYSDPQKYMNSFGEPNQTKPQIIFHGNQSPTQTSYGFNLFIDSLGNVRSKSSRESLNPSGQEEIEHKRVNY